ncbi:MAG: molybdopterin-synthase adenylyltransferase MoeB [Pseudomonadota bacterium]
MILMIALIGGGVYTARFFGMSRNVQGAIVGLGVLFVLAAQLTLPDGNPVKTATGSLAGWTAAGVVLVIVMLYAQILGNLRSKAKPQASIATDPAKLSATELDRYARHLVLREVGGPGQQRLKKASVLVVGAGGLGSPALQYLAAAGVGTIGVIDDDVVSASNLQRQVIYRDDQIDMPKVFAATANLKALNPFSEIKPYNRALTEDIATELISEYDVVLDGTDTFQTRSLVNRAAVAAERPLISGAIGQWEGQVSLFDPTRNLPCYACVFPTAPRDGQSCAEAGVMGALPGIIGSLMATEAIKLITGAGQTLSGRMFIYDALYGENRTVEIEKRADCAVCGSGNG